MKKLTKEQKEKILRAKMKFRGKEEKLRRREKKKRIQELKLDRKRKEVFVRMLKDEADNIRKEVFESFEKMLQELKQDGKLYASQYMSLPLSEVRLEKLNLLGKKGWKFAFEYNGKVFLEREYVWKD